MIITTDVAPTAPLNGDIQLAVSREGHFEEVDLDYETCAYDKGRIVFACYDPAGNRVYIRMRPTVVEESIFGDLSPA